MALLQKIHDTQQEIEAELRNRMTDFEAKLLASSSSSISLAKLSEDFQSFQRLVWSILGHLRQQITNITSSIESLEMGQRRRFLLFSNIPKKTDEDSAVAVIDILRHKFQLSSINQSDFESCYRLGERVADRPRPILVCFKELGLKHTVWKKKTSLKGSTFVVSEFLTKTRQTIFIKTRSHFGMRNCWTSDGVIFLKSPCGNLVKIYNEEVLDKLISKYPEGSSATSSSPLPTSASVSDTRSNIVSPGLRSQASTKRIGTRRQASSAGNKNVRKP